MPRDLSFTTNEVPRSTELVMSYKPYSDTLMFDPANASTIDFALLPDGMPKFCGLDTGDKIKSTKNGTGNSSQKKDGSHCNAGSHDDDSSDSQGGGCRGKGHHKDKDDVSRLISVSSPSLCSHARYAHFSRGCHHCRQGATDFCH
jgi:hypothetical protein